MAGFLDATITFLPALFHMIYLVCMPLQFVDTCSTSSFTFTNAEPDNSLTPTFPDDFWQQRCLHLCNMFISDMRKGTEISMTIKLWFEGYREVDKCHNAGLVSTGTNTRTSNVQFRS